MKIVLLSIFLSCSIYTFGQNQNEVNLIKTDSTWGKEIIQIPFWFAPKIDYKGNEDIRFAKGWEDMDSYGFWTLVFAWDINLKTKPTAKLFEDNVKLYFDGLMKVVNENETLIIPKTKANFIENKTKKRITTFTGTLETYDAFTTKKVIELNVIIESHYCKQTNKYVPFFKISPKDLNHKVWKVLDKIKLQDNICDN